MRLNKVAALGLVPMAMALLPRHDEEMEMDMLEQAVSGSELNTNHGPANSTSTPTPHIMHHAHGVPIIETNLDPLERQWWEKYNTQTYFNAPSKHTTALWVHVLVGLFTFIFIYPIALVLKNVGLKWYMPVLTLHTGAVALSLFNYSIFINLVADLYPGNKFSTMLWIFFFTTVAQYVTAVIYYGTRYLTGELEYAAVDANYFDIEEEGEPMQDLSDQGSSSLLVPAQDSFELTEQQLKVFKAPSTNPFSKVYRLPLLSQVSNSLFVVALVVFHFLNWGNFVFFLVLLPTAVAVFGEFGKEKAVFNMLAHFIKGGVFFVYGLVTLARYLGAFSNKGWAWNHKFIRRVKLRSDRYQPEGTVTMEFVELFLISFYGCTNVFLEHLAGAGGAWTAKDLQHASIAFIYIGCGFGGLICECKLSEWRKQRAVCDAREFGIANPEQAAIADLDGQSVKAAPGFSPNPFPIMTIFWTGVLMLKHAQASTLLTEIHTLWGNLFMYGTFFRATLYILMMLQSKTTELVKPSRPFTELVSAFCLLLGGLIFMELTDPIILAFEWHGWTTMFILNVSLGVVTLLMAWEMAVFAFKDWLVSRK